jgi:hypothetical protein
MFGCVKVYGVFAVTHKENSVGKNKTIIFQIGTVNENDQDIPAVLTQ